MKKQLFSSESQHWCTPEYLLDVVRRLDTIRLDPCSNAHSTVRATRSFAVPDHDGLVESWDAQDGEAGLVWVNPPYGTAISRWVRKAFLEANNGNEIVMTIPARMDTKYMHAYVLNGAQAVCFIKGRIKFVIPGKDDQGAPFPSCLVYYGNNPGRFREVTKSMGYVVDLLNPPQPL